MGPFMVGIDSTKGGIYLGPPPPEAQKDWKVHEGMRDCKLDKPKLFCKKTHAIMVINVSFSVDF